MRRTGGRGWVVASSCESPGRRLWGRRPGRPGGLHSTPSHHPPGWRFGMLDEPNEKREVNMDVVVNARHCEVSDRFRSHVEEKLAKLEKHDKRIMRVLVEGEKERNPRQHDREIGRAHVGTRVTNAQIGGRRRHE